MVVSRWNAEDPDPVWLTVGEDRRANKLACRDNNSAHDLPATGAFRRLRTGEDGACSRASYDMFDAAHAALFALGAESLTAPIKTQGGQFGRHVVLSGQLQAAHGEALNRVQRFRQIAEDSGDPVSAADAHWAVEQAAAFVATIRARFMSP